MDYEPGWLPDQWTSRKRSGLKRHPVRVAFRTMQEPAQAAFSGVSSQALPRFHRCINGSSTSGNEPPPGAARKP
jgi:hypothetical protein